MVRPGVYEYRLEVDGEVDVESTGQQNRAQPLWENEFHFESEWMREMTLWSPALRKRNHAFETN